mmetsp:Transcript_3706/g.8050  ORF Transcript_3706/g.8050 Transcript_3706/m.8050 type:complete len:265 (-) Transcript_3706:68-862(-)
MGLPSSFSMMATARSPPKPGTLSCRSLSTLMYSFSTTSVRVEITWPSLTKVGPRVKSPSRMNSAAAVLAALTASGPPLALRALSTRRPARARKLHTSVVRLNAELLPRCCQPDSMSLLSSCASSSSEERPMKLRSVFHIRLRSSPTAALKRFSSVHTSGSSTSHESSTSSSAASFTAPPSPTTERAERQAPRIRSPLRSLDACWSAAVGRASASAVATWLAAFTLSNSSSSEVALPTSDSMAIVSGRASRTPVREANGDTSGLW